MKINLKEFSQDIQVIKYCQKVLADNSETKALSRKLNRVLRFMEEVEADLEMAGESIPELDMPRLEAIEERDRVLKFYKDGDDI